MSFSDGVYFLVQVEPNERLAGTRDMLDIHEAKVHGSSQFRVIAPVVVASNASEELCVESVTLVAVLDCRRA